MTHGKPCVHMHANAHAYKMGGQFVEKGKEEEKEKGEKGKKERDREEEKSERKREKRKFAFRRSELVRPRNKVRGLHSNR